jgi:hypothetical protein
MHASQRRVRFQQCRGGQDHAFVSELQRQRVRGDRDVHGMWRLLCVVCVRVYECMYVHQRSHILCVCIEKLCVKGVFIYIYIYIYTYIHVYIYIYIYITHI